MYVFTRFQYIWKTSVFVTKFAQKNTLGYGQVHAF